MTKMKFISNADKIFYKLDREIKLSDQHNRCKYCNTKLTKKTATFDHVVPLKQTHRIHNNNNTVVACRKCNNDKGHKDVNNFQPSEDRIKINAMFDRLDERTKLAEYNLDLNPKGGTFKRWKKYWFKRGKWD